MIKKRRKMTAMMNGIEKVPLSEFPKVYAQRKIPIVSITMNAPNNSPYFALCLIAFKYTFANVPRFSRKTFCVVW